MSIIRFMIIRHGESTAFIAADFPIQAQINPVARSDFEFFPDMEPPTVVGESLGRVVAANVFETSTALSEPERVSA